MAVSKWIFNEWNAFPCYSLCLPPLHSAPLKESGFVFCTPSLVVKESSRVSISIPLVGGTQFSAPPLFDASQAPKNLSVLQGRGKMMNLFEIFTFLKNLCLNSWIPECFWNTLAMLWTGLSRKVVHHGWVLQYREITDGAVQEIRSKDSSCCKKGLSSVFLLIFILVLISSLVWFREQWLSLSSWRCSQVFLEKLGHLLPATLS